MTIPASTSIERLRKQVAERYPLRDRAVWIGGREWRLTSVEDQDALIDSVETDADLEHFPYGLLLWASAIGLAARLTEASELVRGKRVLELGAGVGLPGIVARSLDGNVAQTDHQQAALALSRINAAQNGIEGIRSFLADWRDFQHDETYDLVIGSDVLYERTLHYWLARLFPRLLAPGGLLLLSDPLRPQAIELTDQLERQGWNLIIASRTVPWEGGAKEIALFHLRR